MATVGGPGLRERFKDEEHLLRVIALFVGGLVAFLLVQALLVPNGFGVYGHFRAGALDDNRARSLGYAGAATCEACHGDALEAKQAGRHKGVACEACHGPQGKHAEADDPATSKPARPDAQLCLVCHTPNMAKPARFPQVEPREHAASTACLSCHKPHQPGAAPEAKR